MTPALAVPALSASILLAQGDQAPPATASTATPGTTSVPAGTNPPTGSPPAAPGMGGILWMMIIMFGLVIVMSTMSSRREKKKRESMMSSLKRRDKVQTMAGIIGTVEEIYDHEVVLRVDEASNTRIRFNRAAIQAVLNESKASGDAPQTTEVKPAKPATV